MNGAPSETLNIHFWLTLFNGFNMDFYFHCFIQWELSILFGPELKFLNWLFFSISVMEFANTFKSFFVV